VAQRRPRSSSRPTASGLRAATPSRPVIRNGAGRTPGTPASRSPASVMARRWRSPLTCTASPRTSSLRSTPGSRSARLSQSFKQTPVTPEPRKCRTRPARLPLRSATRRASGHASAPRRSSPSWRPACDRDHIGRCGRGPLPEPARTGTHIILSSRRIWFRAGRRRHGGPSGPREDPPSRQSRAHPRRARAPGDGPGCMRLRLHHRDSAQQVRGRLRLAPARDRRVDL
jgi:hypothetical protein